MTRVSRVDKGGVIPQNLAKFHWLKGQTMAQKKGDQNGEKISYSSSNKISVPDFPIIPFIEGDGTGPDIWAASQRVFDAAVKKVYKDKKGIVWKEVLAGEKAKNKTGEWLP